MTTERARLRSDLENMYHTLGYNTSYQVVRTVAPISKTTTFARRVRPQVCSLPCSEKMGYKNRRGGCAILTLFGQKTAVSAVSGTNYLEQELEWCVPKTVYRSLPEKGNL